MTDRELLELAAKAAGHTWRGGETFGKHVAELFYIKTSDTDWGIWMPLHDDGDALRLAVKLRIAVKPVYLWRPPWDNGGTLDDPYAATRRTIVRAAAEIGRAM